ncbi:hypothetical protein RDABS01_003425 [Bienertia sinuspersici]
MGNSLGGGKRRAKIMKINGETMKFKTPIRAEEVVKEYPGHVVLESESVKHYGIRAKPLESFDNLEPKKLYFLVELPKFPNDQHRVPRRVRSGINMSMSAKDRLESLMLSRRSVSDLSTMGPATRVMLDDTNAPTTTSGFGLRLRMKLPKAQLHQLMTANSDDQQAMAHKIMDLCLGNNNNNDNVYINGTGYASATTNNLKGKQIMDQSLSRGSPGGYNKFRFNILPQMFLDVDTN